jgi:hypothetical protein
MDANVPAAVLPPKQPLRSRSVVRAPGVIHEDAVDIDLRRTEPSTEVEAQSTI